MMEKKILLIEDNVDMLDNIAEILELANYKVFKASNGKEGIKLAKESKPDLILCDIMMPELDGYGVLKILTENENLSAIPFIFMSAKAEKTDFREGMRLGADDYLTKPFEDVQLLEAIEMRLKKNRGGAQEKNIQDLHVNSIDALFNLKKAKEVLQELFKNGEEIHFDKKECIFHAGNVPRHLFFVKIGKVKTSLFNDDGKEFISGLYAENDYLGLIDLFSSKTYLESAKFISGGVCISIRKEDFLKELYANKDLAMYVFTKLNFSINIRKERLMHMAYDSVRKRTADSLVWLDEIYNTKNEYPYKISFTREDLASMVGTAKESLIRTLSSFKEEGLIDTNTSEITIFSSEKLKDIIA